jgi:septal ring factor EnvC (AmiA/AmiB activator)
MVLPIIKTLAPAVATVITSLIGSNRGFDEKQVQVLQEVFAARLGEMQNRIDRSEKQLSDMQERLIESEKHRAVAEATLSETQKRLEEAQAELAEMQKRKSWWPWSR